MFGTIQGDFTKTNYSSDALENIQYQLLSSYIKFASEKLANKEASLITQTQLFLEQLHEATQSIDNKDLTEACTTEASLDYGWKSDKQLSFRSKDSGAAFKRKTKFTSDKKTKGSVADALQEIKEVCSERTISTAELIFRQYHKLSEQQSISQFRYQNNLNRSTHLIKKRQKCQTCLARRAQLELKTTQFQEKLTQLNTQMQKLHLKCKEQENTIKEIKKQKNQHSQKQKTFFSICCEYLDQKQTCLSGRNNQLKLIERSISNALHNITETSGCQRCELVRSIRTQVLEYRRHYERQFQTLQKIYSKFKKHLR